VAEQGSRAAATRSASACAVGASQAAQTGLGVGSEQSGQRDQLAADRPASSNDKTDEDEPSLLINLPEAVAKDLSSADARDRYRALDYWEAKDSKAPLDPVFEAMEDEDEGVRQKATAIVEQFWKAQQEQEKEGGGAEEDS